jgi:hypothetical protein
MKGKQLLRVSVLGNLAVSRHRTKMPLPPSKKTRGCRADWQQTRTGSLEAARRRGG